MSLLQLGVGLDAPIVVNAAIEIPMGSSNKYEFSLRSGAMFLDRVLYSPLYYPFDYGWIPGTLSEDGDPLDILVMVTHPTFPGCVVPARPVGALRMHDEHGPDTKILAACDRDPRFNGICQLEDVPEHTRQEIVHFFQAYKELEDKAVEVFGWDGRDRAYSLIQAAVSRVRGTQHG
jgi:inorganic pyrophosphatase